MKWIESSEQKQAAHCDGGIYDEETDTYYCEEGWYETNEYEEVHWAVTDPVTHWMPLPEEPIKTP